MRVQKRYARNFFFSLAILAMIVIAFLIILQYKATMKDLRIEKEQTFRKKYDALISGYFLSARGLFENVIQRTEVIDIMRAASFASEGKDLDDLRENLFDLLNPYYDRFVTYNYRQLHFHLPDNTSFLRFHKPGKWGDDLTYVRPTVRHVNKTGETALGFEEGRIFNGYRFVFPLSFESEHIGSVELSISMKAVIDMLTGLYGEPVQFLLSRAVMEEKVFASETDNYISWGISDRYVLDLGIQANGFPETGLTEKEKSEIEALLEEIPSEILTYHTKYLDDLILFPVKNFEETTVAVLITKTDNPEYASLKRNLVITLFFILGLIVILMYLAVTINRSHTLLDHMATYDNLTDCLSRQGFIEKLQQDFALYRRYGTVVSLVFFDLDKFKDINDRYGHVTGDRVLQTFAATVKANLRETDYLGRIGGDEFILSLPNTDAGGAKRLAELIRDRIHATQFPGPGVLRCSIGVGEIEPGDSNVNVFIDRVDKALYDSKESGRDRITVADRSW